MRKWLPSALLLPAACATAPVQPVGAQQPGVCRSEGLGRFVGLPRSNEVEDQLRAASGARVVRWVTPDMMITMEYREDRLTVRLGTDGRIGSLNCG